jgi:hypothetical protein
LILIRQVKKIFKSDFSLIERKNLMLKKRILKAFKKKESQVKFFFQTGRRRFNIFVTLIDYFGGYPRARGVRNIVHGYPWCDEFPTWSFEVARCVFVYTYSDHLCPLY